MTLARVPLAVHCRPLERRHCPGEQGAMPAGTPAQPSGRLLTHCRRKRHQGHDSTQHFGILVRDLMARTPTESSNGNRRESTSRPPTRSPRMNAAFATCDLCDAHEDGHLGRFPRPAAGFPRLRRGGPVQRPGCHRALRRRQLAGARSGEFARRRGGCWSWMEAVRFAARWWAATSRRPRRRTAGPASWSTAPCAMPASWPTPASASRHWR